jgi:hypothetical protein
MMILRIVLMVGLVFILEIFIILFLDLEKEISLVFKMKSLSR